MLRNIRLIECQRKTFNYTARGRKSESSWSVSAELDRSDVLTESGHFKSMEGHTLKITTLNRDGRHNLKRAVVVKAVLNESNVPQALRQFIKDERMFTKNLVSSVPHVAMGASITGESKSLFYNSLPLDSECGLPVNVHGRFAVSPDRRSLRTDSSGGEWNKFLAQDVLPQLYFAFLEYLILSHRSSIEPYRLWPPAVVANDITSGTVAAFWNNIRLSPRRIFTDTTKNEPALPICQAVFDRREETSPRTTAHLMSLIRRMRPVIVYVQEPAITQSLFASERAIPKGAPDLKCFEPEYVRELLRQHASESEMQKFGFKDSDLKALLDFVLVNGNVSELIECRILRLQDGRLWKMRDRVGSCLPFGQTTGVRYVIDREGFELFKHISSGCLIVPTVLSLNVASRLALTPTFNVQIFDGRNIDGLLQGRAGLIETYGDGQSDWLASVYKYACRRDLTLSKVDTHPMIPTSKRNTFVSMAAWNKLRIMPPLDVQDDVMRRICDRLPGVHVLLNLNYRPLHQIANVDCRKQLLQCLSQFPKQALEKLLSDNLDDEDLAVVYPVSLLWFC
jgi:hypothetical protein